MSNVVDIDKDSNANYIKSIVEELREFTDIDVIVVAVHTKDGLLKCKWCGPTLPLLGLSAHLNNLLSEVSYD